MTITDPAIASYQIAHLEPDAPDYAEQRIAHLIHRAEIIEAIVAKPGMANQRGQGKTARAIADDALNNADVCVALAAGAILEQLRA